jgi:Spy/CpxP family protein refolding chaperone
MLDTRDSLSRAVAGETFDDSAFEAVSARVDATTEKMKDAFVSALRRIHAVLDPKQRERFAELVSKGPFGRWGSHGGGGYGGPYRGGAEI